MADFGYGHNLTFNNNNKCSWDKCLGNTERHFCTEIESEDCK